MCSPYTEAEMGALLNELKNWRLSEHWNTTKFFRVLIFGLLFTFLDTVTDIVFARSVPDECPDSGFSERISNNFIIKICEEISGSLLFQKRMGIGSDNHCGHFFSKGVKIAAFTFIALPGIMLSFSALHRIFRELWKRICGSEVSGCLAAVINAAALLLQMSLCTGLVLVPLFSGDLEIQKKCYPAFEPIIDGFEITLQAMAYSSAAFLIGVKLLGTICHGPEVTKLVERATDAEVRYEAALQLILIGTIYLVSGKGSWESSNSAITSLLVFGKVGIQGFFKKYERELSSASLLGRIYVAISVLPVFVLTALFKIGSFAIVFARMKPIMLILQLCLAIIPPTLVIFLLKICGPLKELTSASISQDVFAEAVSLHTWQNERMGKIIEVGMATYYHILYSSFLGEVISNHNKADGLKDGAIICLAVGWVTFPFIVCLVFYQEKYVKYMVAKHLKDGEEENIEEGQEGGPEAMEEYVQGDEEKIGEKDREKDMITFVENVKEQEI